MKLLFASLTVSLFSVASQAVMNPFINNEDLHCSSPHMKGRFALYKEDDKFVGRREEVVGISQVKGKSTYQEFTVTNEESEGTCVLSIQRKVNEGSEEKEFKIEIHPEPDLLGHYRATVTVGDRQDDEASCAVTDKILRRGCLKEPEHRVYNFAGPGIEAQKRGEGIYMYRPNRLNPKRYQQLPGQTYRGQRRDQ